MASTTYEHFVDTNKMYAAQEQFRRITKMVELCKICVFDLKYWLGNDHRGRCARAKKDVGGNFLHDLIGETVHQGHCLTQVKKVRSRCFRIKALGRKGVCGHSMVSGENRLNKGPYEHVGCQAQKQARKNPL